MKNTLTGSEELSSLDELELIARARDGDAVAFNPIVYKYQQKVYNLIYRRVNDAETAKDLCQEVFIKAWRGLPNFQERSAFYSWLYKIAINCSIDFLRKQRKEIVIAYEDLSLNVDRSFQISRTHPSPDEILEKKELGDIIRVAVAQLPPGQHRAFQLRYGKEFSIKEIACHLNKSEGTVKAHLYHAHQRLREMLRPYLQNESLKWYKRTKTDAPQETK